MAQFGGINLSRRQVLAGSGALALGACLNTTSLDAEIIIIGAGLSGLFAARILAAEDKDVLVVEGSDRIGGRLHTLDHGALGYSEAGGEQLGASYARCLAQASELGVEVIADSAAPPETSYSYKDRLYTPDEWAQSGPLGGRSPGAVLFSEAARANPLTEPTDWFDPKFAEYDISAAQFLAEKGYSEADINLIDHAYNGNNLSTYSMMNLYRTLVIYGIARRLGPSLSVVGGAQHLPEAMAAALPRQVKLNSKVHAIESLTDYAEITLDDKRKLRAQHVISTIPAHTQLIGAGAAAPAYRHPSSAMTQILQVHAVTDHAYWEEDGLPANMWTDGLTERIFVKQDDNGRLGQLIRFWMNGDGARALNIDNDETVTEMCISELARIRPSSRGHLRGLSVKRWTPANPYSAGAYIHYRPGGTYDAVKDRIDSPPQQGRISYAGEHLSLLNTGMEGAMESGERAALALLDG